MARNTATLPASNIFKPASDTITASDILAGQLIAYEGLLRSIQNPALLEALRENDLSQTRSILATMMTQLAAWIALPNG